MDFDELIKVLELVLKQSRPPPIKKSSNQYFILERFNWNGRDLNRLKFAIKALLLLDIVNGLTSK